jgi:hypothetical protein
MNKLAEILMFIVCIPFLIFIVLTGCFSDELEQEYKDREDANSN